MYATSANSGVLDVTSAEAVQAVYEMEAALALLAQKPEPTPQPPAPEIQPEPVPDTSIAQKLLEEDKKLAGQLFTAVRTWLQAGKGGVQ